MRNTNVGPGTRIPQKWPHAAHFVSYKSIAGGLISQMAGFLLSKEPGRSSPPFKLVIIGNRGVVVFECEVGKDGKVLELGPARRLRRSHFPATALLTDRSLVTRTFLIERATHGKRCG